MFQRRDAGVAAAAIEPKGGHGNRLPWPPNIIWLPATVVAVAMTIPLAYLVVRTLGAGYEALDLLFRPRTLHVLVETVLLAITVTASAAAISIPIAWLTVKTDIPFKRLWAIVSIVPLVIPSYVGGFVLVAALGPRGLLQQFLAGPFGIERIPEIYGFPGAALALTLHTYPYMLLTIRAALWNQDPALEEAARGLGNNAGATFLKISLPQLRPAIAAGSLLVALYTLSDFGAVSLLQFDSFTRQIYSQYEGSFDRTLAAVFALVLAALTATVLWAEGRARGRYKYYRSGVGAARPVSIIGLGRWKLPGLVFCCLLAVFALVVPISVLLYWVIKSPATLASFALVWHAALNSTVVSGLAALVTVAMAFPVAIMAVRYPGRFSSLLERLSYMGFALPGIVIALSLVFFGARIVPIFYQTLGMLVFAYMVLFLPQAVGAVRSSLLQVNPRLEEAARSLGYPLPRVLLRVTLPLLRPGLLAGSALVFLTVMKELPATLLVSPIGFKTLATTIWSATDSGFLAQAAAPALLLIAVSSGAIALLLFQERKVGKAEL